MNTFKKFLFTNIHTKQIVAKNTFWLLVGEVLNRLGKMLLVIFAARMLGVTKFGMFSYALAFVSIFASFADSGLNTLVTREFSNNPELKLRYISTAFYLKLIMLALAAILAFTIAPFTKVHHNILLLVIIAFFLFFDALRDFLMAINRAMLRMEREALVKVGAGLATSILGIIFILISPQAISLAFGYALGALLGAIGAFFLIKNISRSLLSHFSKDLIYPIFQSTWPLAILLATTALMFNVDMLMVGWKEGALAIGEYAAAQKLAYILHVIPTFFATALLPSLSYFAIHNKEKFLVTFKKCASILTISSIFITIIGIVLGGTILKIFYGPSYLGGTVAFQLLMLTVIPAFMDPLIVHSTIALGKQKSLVVNHVIALIINLILNFILVPIYGIAGASLATALSFSLLVGLNLITLYRQFRFL